MILYKDEIKLKDGSEIPNYYRDTLGLEYYSPIDKTDIFPLPPFRNVYMVLLLPGY